MPATESAPPSKSVGAVDVGLQDGLTTSEAHRPLEKFGANAMPDTSMHPLRVAIEKFWAPVPWMLEAAIILEVVLGKYVEAAIIAALLIFNAALGLFQESRACSPVSRFPELIAAGQIDQVGRHYCQSTPINSRTTRQ
jgi:H+-transporting ATPase